MKDFDALLNIWNEQKTSPAVDYQEVIKNYKRSRNKFKNKLWIELISMVIAVLIIGGIWLSVSFSVWTSDAAMLIFILCCLFYIFSQIKNLKQLNDDSSLEAPEKHIEHLQNFRTSRHRQNTRNYYIYASTISFALALYFVEFFLDLNVWILSAAVLITIIWFSICTFIIRKVYMRKEEKRFEEMISELQRLKEQFK